jgi:hypothetical protein
MADTTSMSSQNIDLSSWYTLYIHTTIHIILFLEYPGNEQEAYADNPDEVVFSVLRNSSSRIMALGSTQALR